MNNHTECFLCNAKKIKPFSPYYEKNGLVKCTNCGFVFMERIPSLQELEECYSKYSYESAGYLSPLTIKSYQTLLDECEPYRKNNRLLDVGCGRGWFLQEAKKRGWEVYGTEYSETAVALCEKNGLNMKLGPLDPNSFAMPTFDVITSFEVIEHINNPNEELANIYSLLRKGGLFYCTTPNFDSLMRYYLKTAYNVISYPEHLSYYTKKTLNQVCQQNKFRPTKFLSTGISITRIKTSTKQSNEPFVAQTSSDEKLRQQINSKWYLGIAKKVANELLTLSNTGMTLKGYYTK